MAVQRGESATGQLALANDLRCVMEFVLDNTDSVSWNLYDLGSRHHHGRTRQQYLHCVVSSVQVLIVRSWILSALGQGTPSS